MQFHVEVDLSIQFFFGHNGIILPAQSLERQHTKTSHRLAWLKADITVASKVVSSSTPQQSINETPKQNCSRPAHSRTASATAGTSALTLTLTPEMEKLSSRQLGGIRMEATITSPTLLLAVRNIAAIPVLNMVEYMSPRLGAMEPYKVRSLKITKEDYIKNIRDLLVKADEQEVFAGRNQAAAHSDSQQIIIDLFNALGWHTGDDPAAWWLHSPGEVPMITANDVQQEQQAEERRQPSKALLKRRLCTMDALRSFFDQIKGHLPCPSCDRPSPALFNQGGRRQFCLQCKGCKSRMNQDQAREYFGQLIDQGRLPAVDFGPEPEPEAEAAAMEITTDEEDINMPDLGSDSDSSADQAPTHPLHGPRRQSDRLRAVVEPEAASEELEAASEELDDGVVVLLPPHSPEPAPTGRHITNDELQAILDRLDEDLAASNPRRRQQTPNPFVVPPSASPAVTLPSSQPLQTRPHLHAVQRVPQVAATLRSLDNLRVSNFIGKDGNCMFRAMAYHLTGSQSGHMEVRMKAIHSLQRNPDILLAFAAQGDGHLSAAAYLANMAKPGTWGDEIMLMAIAQAHSVSIMVHFGVDPQTGDSHATIYPHDAEGPHYGLYHLARSHHYELLFP